MENIELELQLANLQEEIDHRLKLRSELRQQLADALCPFVVGEQLIDRKGNKAEVAKIKWSSWSEGYEFTIKKIKVNGDLFANEQRVWQSDQWSKL